MSYAIDSLLRGIEAIELPALPALRTGAAAGMSPPVTPLPDYKPLVEEVITVGSQIAEFAADVPVDLRADVANCFLLAQLAADKVVETRSRADYKMWYSSYVATLRKCGWLIEGDEDVMRQIAGTSAQVHQQIIDVLTLALGPAVSAVSLVLGMLNGLKVMSQDQPFFTIFDQASNRVGAKLFQISYVGVGEVAKEPRIRLAAYRLEASATVTQILFFKFQSTNVQLRSFSSDLSMDAAMFAEVRKAIFDKVKDRVVGNIAAIEI
jgi:hypothetical protein